MTAQLVSRFGAVVVAAAGVLTACSSAEPAPAGPPCDPSEASALVMVVGVHQGASAPSVPLAAACEIESAIRSRTPISVVTAEGRPRLVLRSATWSLNDGLPESSNPQAYRDDLNVARSTVLGAVGRAEASSDHHNLMAALAMAGDQGRQSGPLTRVLVIDNGLSDSGPVDMTRPGMTVADPDEVAAFVSAHGGCPSSLAGTVMTMYGAGYGVAPQDPLSPRQVANLGKIWQAVIATCGGRLDLVPTPRTEPGPETPHTVTTVAPEPDAVMAAAPVGATLRFVGHSELRFAPDTAELADRSAAADALRPVADYLNGDRRRRVTVSGTTSIGPTGWPDLVTLADARSQTIQKLLVEIFGVDPTQIRCEGLGYTATPPVVDPATAALNRTTRIRIES